MLIMGRCGLRAGVRASTSTTHIPVCSTSLKRHEEVDPSPADTGPAVGAGGGAESMATDSSAAAPSSPPPAQLAALPVPSSRSGGRACKTVHRQMGEGSQVDCLQRGRVYLRKIAPRVRCAVDACVRRHLCALLSRIRAERPSGHSELTLSRGVVLGGLHGSTRPEDVVVRRSP